MKRVLAVTGIRSEYFLSRSIFEAIRQHPELELQLVVTGSHLSPLHDYSVRAIEQDGFPILERVESLIHSDRDAGRLKGAASQLQILSHIVDRERPDWILAIADREESITAALCGVYLNIPVAHYAAGDRVVGNVDDTVRHAVSRLSSVLFTLSEDSKERLIRSGEEPWRVHFVGHSGIDRLRSTPHQSREELARDLGVAEIPERYGVVIQHSLSSEIEDAPRQMEITLQAIKASGLPCFVSFPNSDAGRDGIIDVIERYRDDRTLMAFRNIPDRQFVNLLRSASVLVGNSSAGVMEAPFLKLGVINVGQRQHMRSHAENIFFVPHDVEAIRRMIDDVLNDAATRERIASSGNPFGDGYAGERVAKILAETPIDAALLRKDLTY